MDSAWVLNNTFKDKTAWERERIITKVIDSTKTERDWVRGDCRQTLCHRQIFSKLCLDLCMKWDGMFSFSLSNSAREAVWSNCVSDSGDGQTEMTWQRHREGEKSDEQEWGHSLSFWQSLLFWTLCTRYRDVVRSNRTDADKRQLTTGSFDYT